MKIEVTTTHLMMHDRAQFNPRYADNGNLHLEQVCIPNPNLNHFFYANVGILFQWYSRLNWTHEDWNHHVNRDNIHTWVGYIKGSPYGYFELEEREHECEILFFGILKQFFGQGLGAHLLSCAIREAWSLKLTHKVYVHTCTLDHVSALRNYQARGFVIDRVVTEAEEVPADDDPIWNCSTYYESLKKLDNDKF